MRLMRRSTSIRPRGEASTSIEETTTAEKSSRVKNRKVAETAVVAASETTKKVTKDLDANSATNNIAKETTKTAQKRKKIIENSEEVLEKRECRSRGAKTKAVKEISLTSKKESENSVQIEILSSSSIKLKTGSKCTKKDLKPDKPTNKANNVAMVNNESPPRISASQHKPDPSRVVVKEVNRITTSPNKSTPGTLKSQPENRLLKIIMLKSMYS